MPEIKAVMPNGEQFTHTSPSGRLTVYEASNGFYVTDNETQETVGCGDGVDRYDVDLEEPDEDGCWSRSLSPGTEEFYQTLRADLDSTEDQWLEAYFGGQ